MFPRIDRFLKRHRPFSKAERLRRTASIADFQRSTNRAPSESTALGSLTGRDWSAAQRCSGEPHRLSLEGLNLEVADQLEPDMTSSRQQLDSQLASSRQQLLEEVLQTKELLQNKQRHKNSGGWTMTTAEILNNADRQELEVQMEAHRQKVQLRQRKMSAALRVQKSPKESNCNLNLGERQHLEQQLQSIESHIRQSEMCARDSLTQIRSRRTQQLRTIQDLGVMDASLAADGAPSALLSPPSTSNGSANPSSGNWEGSGGTLRRPRSLHSPSLSRRSKPLRFISNLGRKQRRSASELEGTLPERSPAEAASPLRTQVSPAALQEITLFEKMMENFLQQQQQKQAAGTPRRRTGLSVVKQSL